VIAENTVPSPEMVGMITSVLVKTTPEREDSETRTVRMSHNITCIHLKYVFSYSAVLKIIEKT
jgi:hypothetical protein